MLILLTWLLWVIPSAVAQYHCATTEISKALEIGQQVASDLETYIDLEQSRLNRIRRVIARLTVDGIPTNLTDSAEDYFGNPINAYLTMKRLAVDWENDLFSLLDASEIAEGAESAEPVSANKNRLAEVRARVAHRVSQLPGNSDLEGAAEALFRLQTTYKLTAEDMAYGRLANESTCLRLTAAQCMHLGQRAYEKQDYSRAEEWFRVAYNRLLEEDIAEERDERNLEISQSKADSSHVCNVPDETKPTVVNILDHLAYALGRQGRYQEALNVTHQLLLMDPGDRRQRDNAAYYESRIEMGEGTIGPAPAPEALTPYDKEIETYQALCRGEVLFPAPAVNSVFCRYYVPHPYYRIGPVKEEVLFPDPKVIMWHDVIHESEIKRIKELATPLLQRATVKNPVTGRLEFAAYRTSKSAWLWDEMDEITHRMNHRIHALTGLSMRTAEQLQVGNYGIGGHYAPHFDFGRKREKDAFEIENGNRVATIIFYLSDVKAGGSTVFNRVGAKVDAVKGAAAFWYNLYPSGEGDLRTRHVACPVLVGSKWVMNVWFHERGQEFIRPCGLQKDPIEVDDGF